MDYGTQRIHDTNVEEALTTTTLPPREYEHEVRENNRKHPDKRNIYVETLHVSRKSSWFQPGKNYLGFVLYQYEGRNDWTLNGIHCKSGYIYLAEESRLVGLPGGTQHQKAYYSLFGTNIPPEGKLVASGFAFQNGQWKQTSGTFNSVETKFTVHTNRTGVDEMDEIIGAVENWRKGKGQNYEVNMRVKNLSASLNRAWLWLWIGVGLGLFGFMSVVFVNAASK